MTIDLQAIEERRKMALENKTLSSEALRANAILSGQDIPALIAEVRRLREELEPLEGVPATMKWTQTTVAELKRHRELAEVVRRIAKLESWHGSPDSNRHRVAEFLKEVHDAQEG